MINVTLNPRWEEVHDQVAGLVGVQLPVTGGGRIKRGWMGAAKIA